MLNTPSLDKTGNFPTKENSKVHKSKIPSFRLGPRYYQLQKMKLNTYFTLICGTRKNLLS